MLRTGVSYIREKRKLNEESGGDGEIFFIIYFLNKSRVFSTRHKFSLNPCNIVLIFRFYRVAKICHPNCCVKILNVCIYVVCGCGMLASVERYRGEDSGLNRKMINLESNM